MTSLDQPVPQQPTDTAPPAGAFDPVPPPAAVPAYAPATTAPYGMGAATMGGTAPIGKVRSTGACIALAIITLGIYQIVWFYKVHSEMKDHGGDGLGGGLAAVLAFVVGFVMPYVTSSEVGALYRRAGRDAPVSGATGLWYFPGAFIIVGPLVWFIKTNGAINSYWRSLGAS